MSLGFKNSIRDLWKERVDSKFVYRGMGLHDLQKGFEPENDLFQKIRPELFHLISMLENALSKGFKFTVYQAYNGWSFSLNDILAWSRNDLEKPGIDFTSSYKKAHGFSKNYRGSQLKQNFKYITDNLPKRSNDPILKSIMGAKDWETVSIINAFLSNETASHSRAIVWLRRSHSVFNENTACLPLGSLQVFKENIVQEIERKMLPMTTESVISVLPKETEEFCYKLDINISLDDLDKVENL